MKQLACFVLLLFATCDHLYADQPNVLFIAIDDLNDWIGCLQGHPQALTPNIDLLAQRGVLFTNAHCAAPACNPSRAAVFTGLLPQETDVWSNNSDKISQLRPNATLLPISFARAGYRTLGTGKLLHKSAKRYFDDYFTTDQRWSPLGRDAAAYTDAELPSKGTANAAHLVQRGNQKWVLPLNRMPSDRNPTKHGAESFDWGPIDLPDTEYGDTKITDWAIARLKEKSDKPLFLGVGYYRPHQPLWAPKRFFERFEHTPAELPAVAIDDLDDLSSTGRKWAIEAVTSGLHSTVQEYDQWQSAVEAYLACITYVDHEVGRLLAALDESVYGDNTIVMLWSDHGWHLGEKEHWGKWTGWERSTRVPLIVATPKSEASSYSSLGSECHQPVSLLDMYPTLVDLCGIKGPDKSNGVSLTPLLQNPKRKTNRAVVTMFDPNNISIRTIDHRYIRYADGSEELYDHRHDLHEWRNLADEPRYRAVMNEMRTVAAKYTISGGFQPP